MPFLPLFPSSNPEVYDDHCVYISCQGRGIPVEVKHIHVGAMLHIQCRFQKEVVRAMEDLISGSPKRAPSVIRNLIFSSPEIPDRGFRLIFPDPECATSMGSRRSWITMHDCDQGGRVVDFQINGIQEVYRDGSELMLRI
jgi:hypothetical protein